MNVPICKQWLMAWISLILQNSQFVIPSIGSFFCKKKSLGCKESLIFWSTYIDPPVRCRVISSTQLEDSGCRATPANHRPGGDCRYWPVSAWRQFEVQRLGSVGVHGGGGSIKDSRWLFSYIFLCSPRTLGKVPILTVIFFKGVETTN